MTDIALVADVVQGIGQEIITELKELTKTVDALVSAVEKIEKNGIEIVPTRIQEK